VKLEAPKVAMLWYGPLSSIPTTCWSNSFPTVYPPCCPPQRLIISLAIQTPPPIASPHQVQYTLLLNFFLFLTILLQLTVGENKPDWRYSHNTPWTQQPWRIKTPSTTPPARPIRMLASISSTPQNTFLISQHTPPHPTSTPHVPPTHPP